MANEPTIEIEAKAWKKSELEFLDERVPSIYSNSANVKFSNWDVSLDFGEIVGGSSDNKLVIAPRVRIMMSLQHAKAFSEVLKTNLEVFEQRFGEIHMIDPSKIEAAAVEDKEK
jgi:hypothetical protein